MEIQDFVRDASGTRVGRPNRLYGERKSFLPEPIAKALRDQWAVAGRDNARVYLRLTETDGANPHYVTAWDGEERYVCYTQTGLAYVTEAKLRRLKVDEKWAGNTGSIRLVEVRQPILRENMERGEVDALMDRVRKTASEKPAAPRRTGAFAKLLEAQDKKKVAKTPYKAANAVGAPQPALKPAMPAPEEPPGRDKYEWRVFDEQGKVKRRPLKHARLDPQIDKRELVHLCKESIGRCAVCYTERRFVGEDSGCGACGSRELVDIRSEGGKNKGAKSLTGGNKTDPQLDDREQVDVRQEDKAGKAKVVETPATGEKGYWGEKVTTPEAEARQKVDVRAESTAQAENQIKPMKKYPTTSPLGAKKPLVFMMLLKGKNKGKGKVEEASGKPTYKLFKHPDDETDRQEVDDIEEMRTRAFKTVGEAHDPDAWHKAHAHKFFANMQKFMSRKKKPTMGGAEEQPKPKFASKSYPAMK